MALASLPNRPMHDLLRSAALMLLLALAGCQSEVDEIHTDFRSDVTEWLAIAESVQTIADLDKAKPELEAIARRINATQKRGEALSPERKSELLALFADDGELTQRMNKVQVRLSILEGTRLGDDLFKTLGF